MPEHLALCRFWRCLCAAITCCWTPQVLRETKLIVGIALTSLQSHTGGIRRKASTQSSPLATVAWVAWHVIEHWQGSHRASTLVLSQCSACLFAFSYLFVSPCSAICCLEQTLDGVWLVNVNIASMSRESLINSHPLQFSGHSQVFKCV